MMEYSDVQNIFPASASTATTFAIAAATSTTFY